MIYIELPLWLVIVWSVIIVIVILYLTFGDFLARIIYQALKDKDKEEDKEVEK